MHVLICEDDPIVALDLQETVAEAGGCPCGLARTYDEAMALAQVTRPSVALVDLHLADGRSGVRIARDLVCRGVRVVVVSSDASVDRDLASVSHVFVAKPVRPAVLRELLDLDLSTAA